MGVNTSGIVQGAIGYLLPTPEYLPRYYSHASVNTRGIYFQNFLSNSSDNRQSEYIQKRSRMDANLLLSDKKETIGRQKSFVSGARHIHVIGNDNN